MARKRHMGRSARPGRTPQTHRLVSGSALEQYTPVLKSNNHFENEINAYLRCIRTGEKLPSHIDTVAITAKIMQAIYDSSDAHREIQL